MNKIIDFLKSQSGSDNISIHNVDKEKLTKSFNDLKNIIDSTESDDKGTVKLKNTPTIKKGQIWLCKQEYYDALGNQIVGSTPYLAIIISEVESIVDENFIRIQPITPFTEFKSEDEILVDNNSIVGFDFLIETWNEQPILTSLLDEFVGNLEIDLSKKDEPELRLSNNQKEFRKAEIRNTEYLRQSIKSLIEFEELKDDNPILLNIENSVHLINSDDKESKTIRLVNESEQPYLQAAKKGRFKERPTYSLQRTIDGVVIEIKIVEEEESYVLAFKQPDEIELKDSNGNLLKQSTPNIYDNLKCGLYFIKVNGIKNEIRIKLR